MGAQPDLTKTAGGDRGPVEWNAFQFHRTLFVRSNPDQDNSLHSNPPLTRQRVTLH